MDAHDGPITIPRQSWIAVLLIFSITSVVETMGVSQISAFLPLDLQSMGLSPRGFRASSAC